MKPVIILGAGASYDYVSDANITKDRNWQPPMTDDLFSVQKYQNIILAYPEVMGLASSAIRKVPETMSLESFLTAIKEQRASNDANRQRQLVALGFYLQHLFSEISRNFGNQPVNHYRSLLEAIKDKGGEAYIVNFNYDTLLEQNIPEINTEQHVDSYINGPVKVIKPHGSYDWLYPLLLSYDQGNSYKFLMENPWHNTLPDNQNPQLYPYRRPYNTDIYRDGGTGLNFQPAIAIPVGNKQYICPEHHVEYLAAGLRNTSNILIIGWKAGDSNLIELLKKEIKNPIEITIVSRGEGSASAIAEKLKEIPNANFVIAKVRVLEIFLKMKNLTDFLAIKRR